MGRYSALRVSNPVFPKSLNIKYLQYHVTIIIYHFLMRRLISSVFLTWQDRHWEVTIINLDTF
jgi:hypothetical protein